MFYCGVVRGETVQPPTLVSARQNPQYINEYFFLTNPEDLGTVLYAKDQPWQLSKIPITFEQFCNMPYMRKHYFIYQLQITSQYQCRLQAEEGVCTIVIETVNLKWQGFLTYKLIYDSKESNSSIDENIRLSRYVIMDRQIGKWTFVVRFPIPGVYRIHIYGGEMSDLYSGRQDWICSFKLFCNETRQNNDPLPCPTGVLGFGANVGLEEAGLHSPSHPSGIIRVNTRQEVDLNFLMTEKVTLTTKLIHKDLTPKTLRKCISQRIAQSKLTITVKVPQEGEYILQVFLKTKDNENNICNYLLTTGDTTKKKKTREMNNNTLDIPTTTVKCPRLRRTRETESNPTEKRARERLKALTESMKRPEDIDDAIDKFCKLQLADNGDLTKAYEQREYLRIKIELEEAMKRSHADTLEKATKQAKNSKFYDKLSELVDRADQQLDYLRNLNKFVYDILEMKQSTVSELHRYKVAQPIIHDVMKATYIILEEKSVDLDDWDEILWLAGKTGKDSLLNRIKQFNIYQVKYATVDAVQKILKPYNEEMVRSVSAVAGTFYVWVRMAVMEHRLSIKRCYSLCTFCGMDIKFVLNLPFFCGF
ncbi:hypothetical protein KUTeg_017819 [Tegillarca granosa]|uniref:KY-like immunoglobulin-like domain-containing protein n=1 Tax=Tegillarca granosa TaxID=220873 RepID=A0ABQ9EG23_TEGGR|nr:hypothetical protein KUTeg_017819 [Tegillarca granosa]